MTRLGRKNVREEVSQRGSLHCKNRATPLRRSKQQDGTTTARTTTTDKAKEGKKTEKERKKKSSGIVCTYAWAVPYTFHW